MKEAQRPGSDQPEIMVALGEPWRQRILEVRELHGQYGLCVTGENAHELLRELRDRHGFHILTDVTAVDFLNKDTPERFQVVYVLHCRERGEFLRIHAWVSEEEPHIESVYDLWRSAKWGERECHDMFGIVFDGNPDLRRFLMPEDYPAFPLLKDYPLTGRDERRQFPRLVPDAREMKVESPLPYPTSIGRGMHTPEYLKEVERDSKPRS